MSRSMLRILAFAFVLFVCVRDAYAQDSGETPKPAMTGDSSATLQSSSTADAIARKNK